MRHAVRSIVTCLATVVLSVALVGCQSKQVAATPSVLLPQPIEIVDVLSGSDEALTEASALLITSSSQLEALGSEQLATGSVDFAQNDVILLTLGMQPTAGYGINVDIVTQEGDQLLVYGYVQEPSGMTAQVLTYPYTMVTIAKTNATQLSPQID